jgi:hypothetical protein
MNVLKIFLFLVVISSPVWGDGNPDFSRSSTHGITDVYEISMQKQFDFQKKEIQNMEKELSRLAIAYQKKKASNKTEYTRGIRGGMVTEPGRPFSFIVNETAKIQFSGDKIESIIFGKRKSRLEYEFEPYTIVQECKGNVTENELNLEMKLLILEPQYKKPLKEEIVQLVNVKDPELRLKFLKLYKSSLRDILFQMELLVSNHTQKTNSGIIESIRVID